MKGLFLKESGAWRPVDDAAIRINQNLPDGTQAVIDVSDPRRRSGRRHRYFFALVGILYANQSMYTNPDHFRQVLLVRLGYCETYPTKAGAVQIAKSVSFAKMSEAEFTQLIDDLINFAVELGWDRRDLLAKVREEDYYQ